MLLPGAVSSSASLEVTLEEAASPLPSRDFFPFFLWDAYSVLRAIKEPTQDGTGSHMWARAPLHRLADPPVPWGWGLQTLAGLP